VRQLKNKDKNNFYVSRDLCEYLANLLGLTRVITHSFTRIISLGLVHKVAEQSLEKEDGNLRTVDIEIPFIGKLNLNYNGNEITVNEFTLAEKFKDQLKEAIDDGKSPLVPEAEKSLIKAITKRYETLI